MPSGGPRPNSGRKPKDEEKRITQLMSPHSQKAIDALVRIIEDKEAKYNDVISASKIVIEYTYGKAKETVETTDNTIIKVIRE
jgi:hypothetical protein